MVQTLCPYHQIKLNKKKLMKIDKQVMKICDTFTRTEKANKKIESIALPNINIPKPTAWIFLDALEQTDTGDKI